MLVTFAVDAEFAPWRKLRKFRFIDFDGLRLWRSDAGDNEITALVTGMGTQAAAKAMDLMMRLADQNQNFDICISSGLAGALRRVCRRAISSRRKYSFPKTGMPICSRSS